MKKNVNTKGLLRWLVVLLFFGCAFQGNAQQKVKLEKYTFGDGLRFTGNKGYNITLSGLIQPYFEVKSFTDTNITENFSRFRIRRMRIRLQGDDAQHKITWRLQVDLSGTNEVDGIEPIDLMDAWVGYNFTKDIRIRVGQKNTPTDNRELLIRSHTLQMVERSAVTSAFSTIREFGIFIDGSFNPFGSMYIRPSIAITNGDGLNVFNADYGGLKYGGRVDFLPFGTFTNMGQYHEVDMMRELTPKLVIGAAYSINNGMSSRRGRNSGAILYINDANQYSLPDYAKWCADFMFKYQGFSMVGEFVATSATVPTDITGRIRNDGTVANTFPVDDGMGGTFNDVDKYVKGRMMLGKGYNIQMGYLFKSRYSLDVRYTHLDADQYSFLNNGTFYNRPNYYTLAASKYFSKMYGFKVQASITYTEASLGSNDLAGNPMNGNEWLFRLITSIAF